MIKPFQSNSLGRHRITPSLCRLGRPVLQDRLRRTWKTNFLHSFPNPFHSFRDLVALLMLKASFLPGICLRVSHPHVRHVNEFSLQSSLLTGTTRSQCGMLFCTFNLSSKEGHPQDLGAPRMYFSNRIPIVQDQNQGS